jgi:hypothetical protein
MLNTEPALAETPGRGLRDQNRALLRRRRAGRDKGPEQSKRVGYNGPMPALLAFEVDSTGRQVIGSAIEDYERGNRLIFEKYPELWAADISVWQSLREGNFNAASLRWTFTPVAAAIRAGIETGSIEEFFSSLPYRTDDAIWAAAEPDYPSELPDAYLELHGGRRGCPPPIFSGNKPGPRAFRRVRSSPILHERASALTWLLDMAATDEPLDLRGERVPYRVQLDAELGAILESWFDDWHAREFAKFLRVARPLNVTKRDSIAVALWLQKLFALLFPRHVVQFWLDSQKPAEEYPTKRILDSALATAVHRNASGPRPLRPLPLLLVRELQRISGEISEKGRESEEEARWALAASGAGWLSTVPGGKRLATVKWMMEQIRQAPKENVAFATTLVREQAELDPASRSYIAEEVEYLAERELERCLNPLLLLLPIVVGREGRDVPRSAIESILSVAHRSPMMKEALRSFCEVTARAARWDYWTLGTETLMRIATTVGDPAKRKQAALLALESIAEARRSPKIDSEVRSTAEAILNTIEYESRDLGDDLELKREMWRAQRPR